MNDLALVMTADWVDLDWEGDALADAPSDSGYIDPEWSMVELVDLEDALVTVTTRANLRDTVTGLIGVIDDGDDNESFYAADSVQVGNRSWRYAVHVKELDSCDCGGWAISEQIESSYDSHNEGGDFAMPSTCPNCRRI